MPPKKIGRPRKGDGVGSNPHVSESNQHASQPSMTSTVPTQPIQQDSLHASSSNTGKKRRKLSLRGPSFRVGGIASMGSQSSEVTILGVRRKKLGVRRLNHRKSTTKFQDDVNNQEPVVNDIPNDVAQAPAVNGVPLVNEVIEEEEIEVSVNVPEPVINEVNLVNNQVPVVNDILNNVAQAHIVNDVPLVDEVIKEEDEIMVLEEEAFDVPVKVCYFLHRYLNEDEPDVDEGEADFVNDVLNDEGEGVDNQDDGDVIEGEGVENQDDGDVIEGEDEGVNGGNEGANGTSVPAGSTLVNGQRSTVNFDRTRRVHKGNSASLDVFTNSLGFSSYTSSTPPDSMSSTWKNRGATPTQLAESQEQLGESQLDSVHLTTLP
uniref:Uncharacterized protein n=1 Tax=Lactuca sativa TaxID=4236 RepID=A0A9R1XBS5_LACSA|nr:hypothetical protein LSAT_V11C500267720 [Lactuca sativa]